MDEGNRTDRTRDLGTVLGVWAHPDDEAYLSSGLMARAAAAGSRVVCVTATRGEGGSLDPVRWPPETLGAVREQELLASLSTLGVTEHTFLDLPDVDWHTPLPEHGAALVADVIREVQPDTVLTFGPDGMTGHVGHQSVSRWTTEAFHAHAPAGAHLYYAVYADDVAEVMEPRLRELGAMREGAVLPVHPRADIELAYQLEPDVLDLKMKAISQHVSQVEGIIEALGEELFRTDLSGEFFRLAAHRPEA